MQYYIKYILSLLVFGSNGVVADGIAISSYEIVFYRSLLGSALLIALFFITRNKITFHKNKKDLLYIFLSGVAMAADWLLLFEAYAQIGVSLGMIINYSGPIIVVALSTIIFKERITTYKIISVFLAMVGVILISGGATQKNINTVGLLCAILSAFSYAAMVIFNKKAKAISGIENSSLQLLFAFICIFVFVICKQGYISQIPNEDIISILWLGFINTGIGCYLYFSSIGKLPVTAVSVYGYLEPLSAVLLSVIFLKETMLPLQILGATLIIVGTILINFRARHA